MSRKQNGFTLVELMVVIVIIGILAALAIPKFMDASTKAKFSEVPSVLSSYDNAQVAYVAENGSVGALTNLVLSIPTSQWFTYDGNTTAGTCTATASKTIGGLAVNAEVAHTVVDNAGAVTHTVTASVSKYMPNFK